MRKKEAKASCGWTSGTKRPDETRTLTKLLQASTALAARHKSWVQKNGRKKKEKVGSSLQRLEVLDEPCPALTACRGLILDQGQTTDIVTPD